MAVFAERGDRDVSFRPSQQIDRGERLDFLETIGQQDEHGGHEAEYQVSSDKYQDTMTGSQCRISCLLLGPWPLILPRCLPSRANASSSSAAATSAPRWHAWRSRPAPGLRP